VTSSENDYDDLSDLNSMEMDSVREWEMQFKEKYTLVGRLLKPGEQHASYSDEDEDTNTDNSSTATTGTTPATTNAPGSPKPSKSDGEAGEAKSGDEKKRE
jgi:membrane-associated progesterone receptor component